MKLELRCGTCGADGEAEFGSFVFKPEDAEDGDEKFKLVVEICGGMFLLACAFVPL